MNIVLDENIPFAKEFFGNLGTLKFLPGRKISSADLVDADALIVRSVTKVNEELLQSANNLKFVGTCTIGTDHIDKKFLADKNIIFESAPGCNKVSVGEYVISALVTLKVRYHIDFNGKTLGIIGAGNTGTTVGSLASILGFNVFYYDPFKEHDSSLSSLKFVSYEESLNCDVVSFHVPLTRDGLYPTDHMLNSELVNCLRENQILINASRGNVWDNQALLMRKKLRSNIKLIMDVWENEPLIYKDLIPFTEIATPHIAGYSAEGKLNGTVIIAKKLANLYGLSQFNGQDLLPYLDCIADGSNNIEDLILKVYDPIRDDTIFRREYTDAESFDRMRKNYPGRRQWSSLRVKTHDAGKAEFLKSLGFSVV